MTRLYDSGTCPLSAHRHHPAHKRPKYPYSSCVFSINQNTIFLKKGFRMKKIFTLLTLVFATLTAMAAPTSFSVTNDITFTDEDGSVTYENQTATLTQNADESWSLTFVDLDTPAGKIGDITFNDISVKENYGEYQITADNATGTATDSESQFAGSTFVMQIYGTGSLSPNGVGSETINFALFRDEDDDFFFECTFAPAEDVDGTVLTSFVSGTSESDSYLDMALVSIINTPEGLVNLNIDGLFNPENGIPFNAFAINNLMIDMNEPTPEVQESYSLKAENTIATAEGLESINVKLLDFTLTPNYGVASNDELDDDFDPGIDEPGVDPGTEGNEFLLDGKLVFTDPETGKDITYIFSTDADKLTAIKNISADADNASDIYSVNGMKLSKTQQGINIVRKNGKMVKVLVK